MLRTRNIGIGIGLCTALGLLSAPTVARADTAQTLNVKTLENKDGTYAFTGIPATLKGGITQIVLSNVGKEAHDLQIVRIEGVHTADEVAKIISAQDGPTPSWMHADGGVGDVAPGGTGRATMNLAAGKYVILCTQQNQKTQKYHSMQGMTALVTVTGAKATALPTGSTATVTASEYAFATTGLKAGKNLVQFNDTGKEIHHFQLIPILSGKTLDDVKKFLGSQNPTGAPPFDFTKAQGSAAIEKAEGPILTEVNLTAGTYAMLCFISDRAGGPPHLMKGMITQLTIK